MNADLHSHSIASDGLLSPAALAARAAANGVELFALTDHDEIAGLAEAGEAAHDAGLRFVPGVEISVTWEDVTVHIVGLAIAPQNAVLREGLASVRRSRRTRAERIAASLRQAGIAVRLEDALAFVPNPDLISRTHFARLLVERGYARSLHDAFQRYLTRGRAGYVPHRWAALADALEWIRDAGGVAVIAHPGRYKFDAAQMRRFLGEFRDRGGAAIEVVTGSHAPEQYRQFARLAKEFGLRASRGSDFHGVGESRADLGALPALDSDLAPVWQEW